MKQRPRIYYTESQKALMWDRWKAGDSLQKIAQLFDRNHSSIPANSCRDRRHPPSRATTLQVVANAG